MIKWTKAQVFVYSNSVLCLGKIHDPKAKWQNFDCVLLMENYWESSENQLSSSNIFQGRTSLQILQKIQNDLVDRNIDQRKSKVDLYSCQCSTTLNGQEKDTKTILFQIQKNSSRTRRDSRKDICALLGPGNEKKWYGNCNYKLEGKWDSIASQMVQRFKETGHPVFTSASALSHGIRKKSKVKESPPFNADASKKELLFRIIHSANQLSIHGAVTGWCEEFDRTTNENKETASIWKQIARKSS